MKITILDGYTLNPGDLNWNGIRALGEIQVYDFTSQDKIVERCLDSQIVVANKTKLDKTHFEELPKLKFIAVSATGYNNINIVDAKKHDIVVSNAVGYSGISVAQHVMAFVLGHSNKISENHSDILDGKWSSGNHFSFLSGTMIELEGKIFGIYGYGKIGQEIAKLASCFGMKVLAHRRSVPGSTDSETEVTYVSFDDLISKSDFLSLNAPLSEDNTGLFDKKVFIKMKSSCYLINTARGGLINENDLAQALNNGDISGAGLDVLNEEPPPLDHPLFSIPSCTITAHNAWASLESRTRLLNITVENIVSFIKGEIKNRIA